MCHSKLSVILLLCSLLCFSCSDDEGGKEESPANISLPVKVLETYRCQVHSVTPIVSDDRTYAFQWSMGDSVLSTERTLDFIALHAGRYTVSLKATLDGKTVYEGSLPVIVKKEITACSPYITSVFDYLPAPGQFVNTLPEYEEGDTQADMNRKVLEAIGRNTRGMVSLGGFGGYVTVGFNHTIVNVPNAYDFQILGNSFDGSSEPGVVQVAYDKNHNGRPDDDEWYELAGSEYNSPSTCKNYEITYTRPDGAADVPGSLPWQVNVQYIAWRDNQNCSGFLTKNIYHSQSYYPLWTDKRELTFRGTRLADNGRNTQTDDDPYWVQTAYAWGYADNVPNDREGAKFKIDWAVDANGKAVRLPGIDFIRIHTGIRQECGWLGECSTEVCGATDLHLVQ